MQLNYLYDLLKLLKTYNNLFNINFECVFYVGF